MSTQRLASPLIALLLMAAAVAAAEARRSPGADPRTSAEPTVPVGVAKIDITPDHPVRLVGYAGRKTESDGVAGRLWAKALAIGGQGGDGPAVLMTVDNCGVPEGVRVAVAARLKAKAAVKPERFMVCSSHTHTGPWLKGFLPWHYSELMPPEHRDHMARYTRKLVDQMESVALEALKLRKPGRLAWTRGSVGFAANRRVVKDGKWTGFGVSPAGAVDHSLPLLRVTDTQGRLLAVVVNYACHCTTLTDRHNQIHGDWAGEAQEMIETDHPGAVAMVCIGCGGDANPEPRGEMEMTAEHGRAVADEVKRLLRGPLVPVEPKLTARLEYIRLPFGNLPTLEELRERVKSTKPGQRTGDYARDLLGRLERGEPLPAVLEYPLAVWAFGDDLAMVFLAGEVVVDYALRLKRELDGSRLWVTAYANDVPCYIASERLIREGGYEVDSSMISYGQPTRLDPAAEDRLISAVRTMVPRSFLYPAEGARCGAGK